MTLRPFVTAACLFALAGAVAAMQPAQSGQPTGTPPRQPGERGPGGQPGGPRGPGRGEQISIEGAMKGMNRSLKQLSGQIADASKKDENLRLVNDAQRFCVLAKGQPLPEKVLEHAKDDASRAKLSSEFRADLIKALRLMLDIESELADGKGDSAKAKLDELVELRDHAHEEMGVEEEE